MQNHWAATKGLCGLCGLALAVTPPTPYSSRMAHDSSSSPRRSLTELGFVIFQRIVAVSCLWFGLQYWAMLVGYSLNGNGRFDLLGLPPKPEEVAAFVKDPRPEAEAFAALTSDRDRPVFTVGDQLLWGAAEPLRRMLRILLER